ncbi:MAG: hypothetical protein VB035_00805 [Candidatus Fimivivens sp.]|nr:hypothetical protein [Candidatus Fimivivens sp.]
MSYYVSLGDVEFEKVTAVTQSGERDISVFDSVGGGKFAVPQNRGLRTWAIKCEIDDHDVIKDLDKMQKKKTPVRLVISSNDYKVSERVLLKSYTASEEEYAGVFPVTFTVIEYVKAGIKTAAVPYMARDGTRVLAAMATIGDGKGGTKTAADLAREAALQAAADGETNAKPPIFTRIDTGAAVNPATLKSGDVVNVSYNQILGTDEALYKNAFSEVRSAYDKVVTQSTSNANDRILRSIAWTEKAGNAVSDAWNKFNENFNKHATGRA